MRSTAILRPALAFGLLAALGACGPVNRGLDSVHQPVVSRTDYVLDVAAAPRGLATGEADRLAGWFESIGLGYGDRVAIDDPSPYGHPGTREEIAAVAARYGLLVSADAPVTSGPVAANALRIVVSRATADVPSCPDWRGNSQPDFVGSARSNYGCSVNSNLAAMVADPQDLVRGQESGIATDNTAATKAVRSYREAEPTGKAGLPGGITSVSVVKTGGN